MNRSLNAHVLNTESSSLARRRAPADRIGANYNSNSKGQGSYRSSPLTAAVLNFDTSEGEEA